MSDIWRISIGTQWNIRHRWFQRVPISFSPTKKKGRHTGSFFWISGNWRFNDDCTRRRLNEDVAKFRRVLRPSITDHLLHGLSAKSTSTTEAITSRIYRPHRVRDCSSKTRTYSRWSLSTEHIILSVANQFVRINAVMLCRLWRLATGDVIA